MMGRRGRAATAITVAGIGMVLAGCASGEESSEDGGEIVITCTTCAGGDDPFLQYRHELATAFNEEYEGQYRIDMLPNVVGAGEELEQAYQRLAIAGDLPDLFVHTSASLAKYDQTQPLLDFAPLLDRDRDFTDTFYDDIFSFLTLDSGKVIGIPEQRDMVGVYYNSALLSAAGVEQPPMTWDDFRAMAESVEGAASIPVAADGLFVTQVWLSHLIGTQPGGADYLNSGAILDGGYADDELWVNAVEYLRALHADGLVNEDAFTGDFQRASVPFLSGEAAAITNGPWYTADITGAGATPQLVDEVTFVAAPEDGVAIFGGDAAWASAADDPDEEEAVWAFIKFAYTFEQQFERSLATGSFGPIKGEFTPEQQAQLNPLAVGLVQASADSPNTYPAIISLVPASFQDAWRNYWPAYVQGDQDTETFLNHLSDSLKS